MSSSGRTSPSKAQLRAQFIANLIALTGPVREIWLPNGTDTTTTTGASMNGRVFTYDATIAARLSPLGLGYAVSFNGTSQYAESPDNTDFTFGNGTNDTAFCTWVLFNVTDTAGSKTLVSKDTTSQREYRLFVTSTETITFETVDTGGTQVSSRTLDSAITPGSWTFFANAYNSTGGATNQNGTTQYVNGIATASTATNNGSYVAMGDKTAAFAIGTRTAHTADFFSGSIAMIVEGASIPTVPAQWGIWQLVKGYHNL